MAKRGWSRIRRSMVGTTKVWCTLCRSTRVSQVPASKRGSTTTCFPWWRATSSPRVPPMWKMGADSRSITGPTAGSMGRP